VIALRQHERQVFAGGDVFDVATGQVTHADVAVEDGRIVELGSGLDGDCVHDVGGLTLAPGIIDCHVHMLLSHMDLWRLATSPISLRVCEAVHNLSITLDAGVTTVRDAAGIDAGVAEAVRSGLVRGPALQVSIGMLCQTGGHADAWTLSGLELPTLFPPLPGTPVTVVDGPQEMRRAVRSLVRAGADVLKIATSGGVLSPRDSPRDRHFAEDELAVLRAEAAAANVRVMAHAHSEDGIKSAVRAGVASVEHGVWLDEEAIELMLANGTYLVPTLGAPRIVLEEEGDSLPPETREQARDIVATHRESFRRAVDAGVKIAMGTDSGVIPHGRNLRELALMEEAGLSAAECWRASTASAADLLGIGDEVGTLAVGMRADVIGVAGDPLGLGDLDERVALVVRAGEVVKRPVELSVGAA
jgi:imidazolonepropionase-like amidohydrolase